MIRIPNILRDRLVVPSGKTVTELAADLGIGRPALSNVLNGNSELSIELAIEMEEVFGSRFGLNALRLLRVQLEEKLNDAREIRKENRNG